MTPSIRKLAHWLSALSVLAVVCGARLAYAEGPEVSAVVKIPDQKDPKQKGQAPSLELTVVNGPKVPVDKFTLSTTVAGQKVSLKPERLREYVDGNETIAIALVINGQEIWIGNDDWADDNSKYEGVLKNLQAAIDWLQLGNAGPPGSKGTVVSYSNGAEVKVPMGDLKLITGAALGSQKDYQYKIGTDMVSGITEGINQLMKVTTSRKALIVVGDGTDTNPDAAKGQLAELKKQAVKQNIQVFAVVYRSKVSGDNNVITTMIPNAKTVNSIDGIATEMNSIIERMKDRYYLTFAGWDPKIEAGLPWDGKEHDLVLRIDQTDTDPLSIVLAPKWEQPRHSDFPWLMLILIVVGAFLLLLIGVKVFGRKKEEPMPVPAPVLVAAPEAPKPMGPAKTVMIGVGGDEGGFPIVGWLVPLNGQHAYHTYRLRSGGTKIGTAHPSDIVVNDGFMSTDHCQINCSPAGFTLIDGGSTNGSYVNDRKVAKHELVDNDMITLGKTSFKFKSIN